MTAQWHANQNEWEKSWKRAVSPFSRDTHHHYGAQQVETLKVDAISERNNPWFKRMCRQREPSHNHRYICGSAFIKKSFCDFSFSRRLPALSCRNQSALPVGCAWQAAWLGDDEPSPQSWECHKMAWVAGWRKHHSHWSKPTCCWFEGK